MDGQSSVEDVAAVAALVQALASLELEPRDDPGTEPLADELIEESRFLAARDGIAARLIDERTGRRLPVIAQLERLLDACLPHARRLGCERQLDSVHRLVRQNGAERQLAHARDGDLSRVTAHLADAYPPPRPAGTATAAASPPTSPTRERRPRPPSQRAQRSRRKHAQHTRSGSAGGDPAPILQPTSRVA